MVKSSYGGQSEADRLRLLTALLSDDMPLEEVLATAEALLPTCYNRMPDGICKGHPHSSSPTGVVYHEAAEPFEEDEPGSLGPESLCRHIGSLLFRVCTACSQVLEIRE